MGWLRDLMEQAPTPVRSLGDLSRSALRSSDWPADTRMQERSLAALFSKLDRDQELDWLGDRPGAQVALAKALGANLDDIRARVRRRQEGGPGQVLRLKALPAGRALSLLEEPLFPGIPGEVLEPAGFERLHWLAPSGSGRTLAGRWLEARGLARFVRAATWAEAATQLPAHGAVFVELEAPDGAPISAPPGLRCCIASPLPLEPSSGFRVVTAPPPDQYLEALVAWVAERSPKDGRFEPERVLAWLSGELLERGIIDSPGAALGLCGLADELGTRALSDSLEETMRRYAHVRFAAALEPDTQHAVFFKKNGYGTLIALVRRLLAEDDGVPWDAPRPRDRWLALVPEELKREADVDWLKMTLGTGPGALRSADLERAARKLPPGAFRVIRSFEQAGMLEPAPDDRLKLGPRFLARALLDEAVGSLAQGSPHQWGAALLEGSAKRELEAHVLEQARATNGASLEPLLETSSPDSLAYVGALELGFVAAGLALLEGAELPVELREGLFEDQLELMLELPGELPVPRVLRGSESERAERHALWLLAALSLSEELPKNARRHALLRPWVASEVDPRFGGVLDRIASVLDSERLSQAAALGVFALIGRLRTSAGALVSVETPHALEQPTVLVEEVAHGVLTWPTVAGLGRGRAGLLIGATRAAALTLDVPWAEVARAIWLAWDAAARPGDDADFLLPDNDVQGLFWAHIPRELLRPLLLDARDKPMPFERLRDEPWAAIEDAVLADALPLSPEIVQHAPQAVLDSWLTRRGLEPFQGSVLRALLERLPERLLGVLALHLEKPAPAEVRDMVAVLNQTPTSLLEAVLDIAEDKPLVRLPGPTLGAMRKLLHRAVSEGGTLGRRAYPILAELEQKLSTARRQ